MDTNDVKIKHTKMNAKKMKYLNFIPLLIGIFLLSSCANNALEFDASGTFEAEETIISAEANGIIKQFHLEEGMLLSAGQEIGYVDSTQLVLKKKQLAAQINAILSRSTNIPIQVAANEEQLKKAEEEKIRIQNLINSDAAPTKQLDDINTEIAVIKKNIEARRSALETSNSSIRNEVRPIQIQIAQIDDQLAKCRIINPVPGTVLVKYAEENEMAMTGKALYKIADLSEIILRVYITGNQLSTVKLGQKVTVQTDDGKLEMKKNEGTITWISNKAEFTPKAIQTKEERANKVYALKVKVKNDGTYKIGMYAEIIF